MKDLEHYKGLLTAEKTRLELALKELGVQNPEKVANWDVNVSSLDVLRSDENELADQAEEANIDTIVIRELEARYHHVCRALGKIDSSTYGICEVSGEPIEDDRLEANPAARTCKAHMRDEETTLP